MTADRAGAVAKVAAAPGVESEVGGPEHSALRTRPTVGAGDSPADLVEELRRRLVEVTSAAGRRQEPPGHPEDAPGDEETVARAVCLKLLADSAQPRAGLEQALRRRGISDHVVADVLDHYTELGLIDDHSYAEAYVRTKHRHRALSRSALAAELRRKGVDDSVATAAVATLDSAAERQRAAELIERRVASAMVAGEDTARRRLLGLLARRGYPSELATEVVEAVIADHAKRKE